MIIRCNRALSSSTSPNGTYFSSQPISWSAARWSPRVFPPARVLANLHRGFAIDAQALDLCLLVEVFWCEGLAILVREVGEDGVCFREFFWGLALTTLRRR